MSDVMMPGMDGWTVLRALKDDPTVDAIPVIMVTMVDNQTMGYLLGAARRAPVHPISSPVLPPRS